MFIISVRIHSLQALPTGITGKSVTINVFWEGVIGFELTQQEFLPAMFFFLIYSACQSMFTAAHTTAWNLWLFTDFFKLLCLTLHSLLLWAYCQAPRQEVSSRSLVELFLEKRVTRTCSVSALQKAEQVITERLLPVREIAKQQNARASTGTQQLPVATTRHDL